MYKIVHNNGVNMIELVTTDVVFEDPAFLEKAIGVTEGLQLIARHDPAAAETSASICRVGWNGNVQANGQLIGDFMPFSSYGDFIFGLLKHESVRTDPDQHQALRQLLSDPNREFDGAAVYPARLAVQSLTKLQILIDTYAEGEKGSDVASSETVIGVIDAIDGSLTVDPYNAFLHATVTAKLEELKTPKSRFRTAATAFTSAKNRSPRD
jgi:hypothetical protein